MLAGEFRRRLDDEFDFMVAPLVFDLELRVHPASLAPAGTDVTAGEAARGGWKFLHVYGSPDAKERRLSGSGTIMRVSCGGSSVRCACGTVG